MFSLFLSCNVLLFCDILTLWVFALYRLGVTQPGKDTSRYPAPDRVVFLAYLNEMESLCTDKESRPWSPKSLHSHLCHCQVQPPMIPERLWFLSFLFCILHSPVSPWQLGLLEEGICRAHYTDPMWSFSHLETNLPSLRRVDLTCCYPAPFSWKLAGLNSL